MKCTYSENDIALFVEDDLAGSRLREVEAHLAACAACSELALELRESQAVFKALKQDTVSASALASLRNRVLAEVVGGNVKAAWGRWVYAVAGSVFAAVIGVGLAWYASKPAPAVEHTVKRDSLPAAAAVPVRNGDTANVAAEATPTTRMRPVRISKGTNRRAAPPAPVQTQLPVERPGPKQLVVKLLTDDPNIVIYWLVDQTGGSL